MSNRPKAKTRVARGSFDIAEYRAEVKGEPFVLRLDAEKSLSIPRPTGDQMLDAEEASMSGTSRDVLRALCGDQYDEFMEVLGPEDGAMMTAVSQDMQKHFGLGN